MSEALKYKPSQEESRIAKPKKGVERKHLKLVKDDDRDPLKERLKKFDAAKKDREKGDKLRKAIKIADESFVKSRLAKIRHENDLKDVDNTFDDLIKKNEDEEKAKRKAQSDKDGEEVQIDLDNIVIAGQSQLRPRDSALEPVEEEVPDFEDAKVKAKSIERHRKNEVKRAGKRKKEEFADKDKAFFKKGKAEGRSNRKTIVEAEPDKFSDIEGKTPKKEAYTDEKTAVTMNKVNDNQKLSDTEVKDKLERMYAGKINTDLLNEGYNAEERLRTAELNLVSLYRKLPDFQNTPDDQLVSMKVGLLPIVAGEFIPFLRTKTKQICKEIRQSYKEYIKIRDDKKEREAREFLRSERAAINNPERDQRKGEEARLLRITKR